MVDIAASRTMPPPAEPLPALQHDYLPLLLVPVLAIASLPFILWAGGSVTTWITLTIAALAMAGLGLAGVGLVRRRK